MSEINAIIKLKRGTALEWTTTNPILSDGEPGIETDTKRTKYGDGSTHWNDLAYAIGSSSYNILTVYSGKSVAANTTEQSTAQDINNVSYVNIYIKNSGSTNVTINVYSSLDILGTIKTLIGTTTVNATTFNQDQLTITNCPKYLFFDVINNDTIASIIDIAIQRTLLIETSIPYIDILTIYSAQAVSANETLPLSSAQDVRGYSYIIPYIKNASSTNLVVNIYGSYDSTGTIKTLIRKYKLDFTTNQVGDPIEKCPNYIFFEVINLDTVNSTTIDISMQRG